MCSGREAGFSWNGMRRAAIRRRHESEDAHSAEISFDEVIRRAVYWRVGRPWLPEPDEPTN